MANIPTIHNRTSQLARPVRRNHKVTRSEHPREEQQQHSRFSERRRGERRKQRIKVHLERRSRHSNRRLTRGRLSAEKPTHDDENTERMGRHINTEA